MKLHELGLLETNWNMTEGTNEIKKHIVYIEKGLTREEAMKKAPWKKSYGDVRGFKYDKNTGRAVWV